MGITHKFPPLVKCKAGVLPEGRLFCLPLAYAGMSWKPNFAAFFFMYFTCWASYCFWYSFTLNGSYSTLYFSILYTTRAIACAVATVAWAGPKRDRKRRYNTPNGQSAFFTDCAAMRKACPARLCVLSVRFLSVFPPEISCFGASPNHEQKCFSVGNFVISVPTSMMTVCASDTSKLLYGLSFCLFSVYFAHH